MVFNHLKTAKLIISASVASLAFTCATSFAADKTYNIQNRWIQSNYLHTQNPTTNNGNVEVGTIYSGWLSAQWLFLDQGDGDYKIKSSWSGKYMHMDNTEGKVEYDYGAHTSELWNLEPVGDGSSYVRLVNKSTGKKINIESNNGYAEIGGTVYDGWKSGQWKLKRRCSALNPFSTNGENEKTFDIDGTTRRAVFYTPSGYDGNDGLPLMFMMHGTGHSPEGFYASTGMKSLADSNNYILVGIEHYNNHWNTPYDSTKPDDIAFIQAVKDWAEDNLCVDMDRVYAMGFSGGARTASRMPCEMSGIKAIAAVAGIRHDSSCATSGYNTPVLAIHGDSDATNPYAGLGTGTRWNESVESAIDGWREADECSTTMTSSTTPYTDVERREWSTSCNENAEVLLYKVTGGTHLYNLSPNFNESQEIMDFFNSHK